MANTRTLPCQKDARRQYKFATRARSLAFAFRLYRRKLQLNHIEVNQPLSQPRAHLLRCFLEFPLPLNHLPLSWYSPTLNLPLLISPQQMFSRFCAAWHLPTLTRFENNPPSLTTLRCPHYCYHYTNRNKQRNHHGHFAAVNAGKKLM